MKKIEFISLGSIVLLNGGVRKVLIIARAVAVRMSGTTKYFEYGGCLYPEGLLGDAILYFNGEDIQKVVHQGYVDDDDKLMVENLNRAIEKMELEKGTPIEWNNERGGRTL